MNYLKIAIRPKLLQKLYTFDSNLDLKVKNKSAAGVTTARDKKFRGVCIVRIYPDATGVTATATTANSSLLGNYTIAGVYTEMEENKTAAGGNTRTAMIKSDKFSNTVYDELIILRIDKLDDTKNTYRADILFNDDEGIDLYDYKPDRIFKNQNTDYKFVKVVKATS